MKMAIDTGGESTAAGHTDSQGQPVRAGGTDPGVQVQEKFASILNSFNAPITASGAIFGTEWDERPHGQRHRARTGKLTEEDVKSDLDHFVRPASFEDAAEVLARDHVVVLVGPATIGKATSATALLRQVTDGSLAILSPTVTITDLADRVFKAGLGYVVKDWQHDQSAEGGTDFAWRTLRDQVRDAGAFLVITTVSAPAHGTAESVRHIDWEPPATRDLLASYLSGTAAEGCIDDIANAVPSDCTIASLVALARRLLDGEDPAEAVEKLSQETALRVQQWFADDPPLSEILEMIALAFAAGRRERAFETILTRLRKTIEAEGYALADNDVPRPLSRVRADRYRTGSMIRRETVIIGGIARTVVNFRADSYRYQVIAEAWRNYDVTFWNIIRTWLDAVITDCPAEGSLDTHIAVAMGLATMAQVDLSEVLDSYLDRWASGSLGRHGQQVAIYVLWLMCFNDALAPVALRLAVQWATAGDPARRWSAVTALSGDLGVRYPAEATNRLWHLITLGKDSAFAINALAQLFAVLSAHDQDAELILAFLNRHLDGTSRRGDLRKQNLVMLSTLAVLSVKDARSGLPSITTFLRANPERRPMAAHLWGEILRHRPSRRHALAALADAVSAFGQVSDKPEADARALGEALARALTPGQQEQLTTDLASFQAHRKRKPQNPAIAMDHLLAALAPPNRAAAEEPKESPSPDPSVPA